MLTKRSLPATLLFFTMMVSYLMDPAAAMLSLCSCCTEGSHGMELLQCIGRAENGQVAKFTSNSHIIVLFHVWFPRACAISEINTCNSKINTLQDLELNRYSLLLLLRLVILLLYRQRAARHGSGEYSTARAVIRDRNKENTKLKSR